MDKYVFNGIEYNTNEQVLPPTYSQANSAYWVALPGVASGITHVSLTVYFHDLDERYWTSSITANFVDNSWKVDSARRKPQ